MFVFAFSMIALLCTLDIITTHYVISRLIGYESNEILASILGGWFYMFKYFATLSVVLGIAAISKNRKLEIGLLDTKAMRSSQVYWEDGSTCSNTLQPSLLSSE